MTAPDAPFRFTQEGNVSVLVLLPELNKVQWGEIDSIGNQVLNSLEPKTSPSMIVDLSHLNYMGSEMVALIVRVWKATVAKKGKLSVICPHAEVREVLQVASLDKHWAIVATQEEARASLGVTWNGGTSPPAGSSHSAPWKTIALVSLGVLLVTSIVLVVTLLNQPSRQQVPVENNALPGGTQADTSEKGAEETPLDQQPPPSTEAPKGTEPAAPVTTEPAPDTEKVEPPAASPPPATEPEVKTD